MPLDVLKTLDPDHGLTRSVVAQPPDGRRSVLWTVGADIGQRSSADEPASGAVAALAMVGACGITRADAVVRAAGETVERYALLRRPGLPPPPPGARRVHGAALVAPEWCPDDAQLWYGGRTLVGQTEVAVPAELVDYPVPDAGRMFDPSPSGAASGPDLDWALRAACRELLERDAAMLAWYRQVRLPAVPLEALGAGDATVARLLDGARTLGLEVCAGTAPTAIPGVGAVIALAFDRAGHSVAAGLGLGNSWIDSVTRAVRESLQVSGLLRLLDAEPTGAAVTDDVERAGYCCGPVAVEAARAWSDAFIPADDAPALFDPCPGEPGELVPDGVFVRLTGRLPERVGSMGWEAVHVVSPGLQPLRMDESLSWSLHTERLRAPEEEWPLDCGVDLPGAAATPPHLFI